MSAQKLLQQVIRLYPYVSYSPLLTACALLGLGVWLTSWMFVSVGVASLVYQIWGYAYRRDVASQVKVITYDPDRR